MTSLQYYCIPGLAEIKTYAQKMQDAQVTKSLYDHNETPLPKSITGDIAGYIACCMRVLAENNLVETAQ